MCIKKLILFLSVNCFLGIYGADNVERDWRALVGGSPIRYDVNDQQYLLGSSIERPESRRKRTMSGSHSDCWSRIASEIEANTLAKIAKNDKEGLRRYLQQISRWQSVDARVKSAYLNAHQQLQKL